MPPCNAQQVIYSPRSRDCDCDQSTLGVISSSSAGRGDHPGSWCDGEKPKPRGTTAAAHDNAPSEGARISADEGGRRGRRRRPLALSDRAVMAWFATLTAASFVLGCVTRYRIIAMRNEFRHQSPSGERIRAAPAIVSDRRDLFRDAHPPRRHRPPPRHMARDVVSDVGPAPSHDVAARDFPRGSDHLLDWDRYHRSDRAGVSKGENDPLTRGSREALVHPAMFAHPNPRSVGLVGMAGGLDLRSALVEVLRHNTVDEVTLIGCGPIGDESSDDVVGSFLRNEVGRWSVADGGDDARTWFADNVAALSSDDGDTSDRRGSRFDVVMVDLRSLSREVWREVLRLAAHSLTAQGVVVIPLGESPSRGDPPLHGGDRYYAGVTEAMVNVDKFETFGVYEESRGELGMPSSFLLACLDDCDYGWYSNEAEVNAMIHRRIDSCPDDDDDFHASSILTEFDGATMGGYQRPPKAWETVYCRRRPTPSDCLHMAGFDPSIPNAPASMFEVKTEDANVGRGVFATEAIPAGSYVMQEKGVQSVQFPPKTSDTLERLAEGLPEEAGELRAVTRYMYGYGFESWVMGDMGNFVDSSISTFTNHGCNGTYNTAAVNIMPQISRGIILTEYNADPANMPWLEEEGDRFNPVMLRHLESYWTKNQRTFRDIRRGDEVLENYLFFTQCEEEWVETVRELKAMCSGDEIGLVVLRDSSAGENASVAT